MTTPWHQSGSDPDYRFSLANERTFLAWIRTALAILAGAIVIHQLQPSGAPSPWLHSTSVCLAILSALVSVGAYQRWRANESAMRHGASLTRPVLVPVLAAALVLVGVAAGVLLVTT